MNKIDNEVPKVLQTAAFSMGCFWGPEAIFGLQKGVYRTRVGYAGGTTENPTYHNIGNYIETVQLDFNPNEISYKQLLEIFWNNHSPEYPMSRQYMSVIYYISDEQKEAALQSFRHQEKINNIKLYTQIMPLENFYLAEAYHQKFFLQQVSLLKEEIRQHYEDFKGFMDSTAAARVNGYMKGLGKLELLMQDIDKFGLSEKGKKRLIEIVDSY